MTIARTDGAPSQVLEGIALVAPKKEMYLIPTLGSANHSVFAKVVSRSLPFQHAATQAVSVLSTIGRLVFGYEQHNLVVAGRRHDSTRDGVVAGIAPYFG
jgi:hypothetical protein